MKNYDNFFLGVGDLKVAQNFYSQTLDLELKFDFSNKGMVAFNVGNEECALYLKTNPSLKI